MTKGIEYLVFSILYGLKGKLTRSNTEYQIPNTIYSFDYGLKWANPFPY